MGEMTKIRAFDEDAMFGAYVAKPAGEAKAAMIVIPEIFGVNPGIRQKCDKWAEAGYLAVAIDIFWRFAPGSNLIPILKNSFRKPLAISDNMSPMTG